MKDIQAVKKSLTELNRDLYIKSWLIQAKEDDDENGTPKPNPSRCRRCGTCMAACFDKIPQIINDFVEVVEDLGPNPFKDF